MWFPVLQKSGSSPARPEQNMLPHTFLPVPERRGESEEVRGEGEDWSRCMAGRGKGKSD